MASLVAALAVLVAGGCNREPKSKQANQNLPPRLAADMVAAWKQAGFEPGWFIVNEVEGTVFFRIMEDGKPGELPAFQVLGQRIEHLDRVSDPGSPFGMRLAEARLSDADLKAVGHLKSLQVLDLSGNQITDGGLKELAGLQDLRALELDQTLITDAGIKELAALKTLESLRLADSQVTGAGFKELDRLEHFTVLSLHGSKVTDEGLKGVGRLKHLKALQLPHTNITDAGLKELVGLKNLRSLALETLA